MAALLLPLLAITLGQLGTQSGRQAARDPALTTIDAPAIGPKEISRTFAFPPPRHPAFADARPAAIAQSRLCLAPRAMPPFDNLRIVASIAYPPPLLLPSWPPMSPSLPAKRKPSQRPEPLPPLTIATVAYPPALTVPDAMLPPLPPIKPAITYPQALNMPSWPPMSPSIPVKRKPFARPAPLAPLAIAIATVAYPPALTVPEAALPPLPPIAPATTYPPPLVLPVQKPDVVAAGPDAAPPFAGKAADALCRLNQRGHRPQTASAGDRNATSAYNPRTNNPRKSFALQLVAAAKFQMNDLVLYNADYITLSYPMGDVPSAYGVCTDVLVRSYRRLGIDLQELIHRARLGRGDVSIDHRRTEILRIFFKRFGIALPITEYPEDYRPGDIVTYHRPKGRSSKSHIAIVSDEIAPTGRPYVLHNRAWGVQSEDALFADEITGHYRFDRLRPLPLTPPNAATGTAISRDLPQRAPPQFAAKTAPPRFNRPWRPKRSMARALQRNRVRARLVKTALPPLPVRHKLQQARRTQARRTQMRRTQMRRAQIRLAPRQGRRLSLCSPLQPPSVKARISHLCSATAQRKPMGLGGPFKR